METYDESVDADSIHSSERDSWDDELDDDGSYSVSSADKSSTDGNNDVDEVGGDIKVRFDTITAEEIRCMEFATVSEAYDFYYRYGKYNGFAVRKSDSRVTGSGDNKVIKMKQFVCNKHGVREKRHLVRTDRKLEHRRLTRTQCGARLRVNYKAEKDRYVVTAFEETHNHELTPARFVHLHPVYRKIFETDKAQVDGLQKRGIRTCHIMGYMVAQKGGYADGDVAASLNYLNMKSSTDPMLYAEYAVDNINGRMNTLFWADGISRTDYFCFGDVLAFDTTYSKNKYNYPLVIFSGCNHHSQTVIFGAALVSNETTETYKWVLRCFLECMEGKQPKAVVTDGDGAMREAIKQIFPDANHRLCAWHLNKNAGENVKNGNNFLDGFSKAMYSNFTIDEFEEYWSHMIKENGVQGHPWVVKTYENRSLWATAYLRDNFFGWIRTTSQCEAVNAIIKSYVRKKGCIFEFMNNFDQALRDYRNNELVADFKSSSTDPVLSTQLPVIESHACKIYTAAVFKEVRHEILKAGELIVRDKSEVGGEEHVDRIPDNLVLSRWTKDAKIQYLNISNCNDNVDSNTIAEARFGSYCTVLTDFCREASKKDGVYAQIMEDLMQLKIKYCSNDDAAVGTQKSAVGDPVMVKSKGAPKKKKMTQKLSGAVQNAKIQLLMLGDIR
ncbi:protein FAR1-RELATED SEQUENCE 5-like [Trifolium pratense]|uniref:protein FAR1-RELATED SEQUENCE 5-like n=1 Tax=Trifolium pratense TaxID=57577 RepID=UPI001E697845|nr:protein FAR1-RELATED SEQUENCE 5-like [Trifolium pratense]